jgi:diguanylate cyclase (GGDEF)-like protein
MDSVTALVATAVVIALLGALVGTVGFSALVVRREQRRLADLAERLAGADDDAALVAAGADRIGDPRLRRAMHRMADRMAETRQAATIDPLTGILNRQTLLVRLDEELARAVRYKRPLSVVLVDIDHFKRINDTHGHDAGDRVLDDLARQLSGSVRSVDVVGRYGGEEFLLILPETDADAAAAIAEKLRWVIGSREVKLADGHTATMTISAGVAGGPGEVLRRDALVRDADAALYSAKALGRNQVYVFRETGDEGTVRRAPVDPAARRQALDVGRAAMEAAQDALLRTLAGRESWAGKPSTLIAEASVHVARALGLPDGELDRIRTASLLHDLGKLAIPDEILTKPGDLDEPEWRIVAEHPKIGQVVLEQAGALREAAVIVLHHHEWFDGRGYPMGLAGNDIPIGARIVSIADAYEAMVAGRPYRAAISHDAALAELRRHAGYQFDPQLVDLFVDLFAGGVPWTPELQAHDHPHLHAAEDPRTDSAAAADTRSHAEIHDDLHDLRRRVVRTGTDG